MLQKTKFSISQIINRRDSGDFIIRKSHSPNLIFCVTTSPITLIKIKISASNLKSKTHLTVFLSAHKFLFLFNTEETIDTFTYFDSNKYRNLYALVTMYV